MRKILLLSDTHSHLDTGAIKYIEEADEVWHAGDIGNIAVCKAIEKIKPLRAVYGNIDDQEIRNYYPEHNIFYCEEVKVFLTHIGGNYPYYKQNVKEIIEKERPLLFICGHSHILKVIFDSRYQLLHINPGAAGIHGFHKIKTLVRFTVSGKEIKDLAVIELGTRAALPPQK